MWCGDKSRVSPGPGSLRTGTRGGGQGECVEPREHLWPPPSSALSPTRTESRHPLPCPHWTKESALGMHRAARGPSSEAGGGHRPSRSVLKVTELGRDVMRSAPRLWSTPGRGPAGHLAVTRKLLSNGPVQLLARCWGSRAPAEGSGIRC